MRYNIEEIFEVFKNYKASKGKVVDMEAFKTTYLYKGLTKPKDKIR